MKHADILIRYARKELSAQVKQADILIRCARKKTLTAVERDIPVQWAKKYIVDACAGYDTVLMTWFNYFDTSDSGWPAYYGSLNRPAATLYIVYSLFSSIGQEYSFLQVSEPNLVNFNHSICYLPNKFYAENKIDSQCCTGNSDQLLAM